jgi:hypothetical protein
MQRQHKGQTKSGKIQKRQHDIGKVRFLEE